MQLTTTFLALASTLAASAAAQDFSLVGFGAGTTGGGSAASKTVTSCSALESAVGASGAAVIRLTSILSGCGVMDVESDKTITSDGNGGLLEGGFRIKDASNVIIQNLDFGHPGDSDDVIALDGATKVWIDHNSFHSDGLVGDKDGYDGQLDITHASDYVTVSWNTFEDHWKASLVGHSDSNESEDTGHLRVTYHHNLWNNVNSRTPSLRFGTGHIYNSVFTNIPTSGINSRMGAQVLVENSIFRNVVQALVTNVDSDEDGYMTSTGNVLTNSTTSITQAATWKPSYSYTLDSTSTLESVVTSNAGAGVI